MPPLRNYQVSPFAVFWVTMGEYRDVGFISQKNLKQSEMRYCYHSLALVLIDCVM